MRSQEENQEPGGARKNHEVMIARRSKDERTRRRARSQDESLRDLSSRLVFQIDACEG